MASVIVVALSAEARPLIEALALRAVQGTHPFRLFAADDCHLVVCGVGKVQAAAACGWAAARIQADDPAASICWINTGICGHASRAVGTVLRINRVQDAASGVRLFPPNLYPSELAADALITVDRPEREFATDCAFDMEASAVYQAAARFSVIELISIVKVVSDGPGDDIDRIDRNRIVDFAAASIPAVLEARSAMSDLAVGVAQGDDFEPVYRQCINRWHFTKTREHRLRSLLRALSNLDALPDFSAAEFSTLHSAQAVLDRLDAKRLETPLVLQGDGAS